MGDCDGPRWCRWAGAEVCKSNRRGGGQPVEASLDHNDIAAVRRSGTFLQGCFFAGCK
ncbi:hypothetical protein BD626DRAFT_513281 [Schizophyllum amplum]|uniref:Uncharacterized protein n=1 Tax=Schizophyllum amplum TaxID=97359 RepID=A0A550BZJ3_9AGAR|nr:hypothetical protein BD626DRAFT_513281 [Auriculariopsis ampla]